MPEEVTSRPARPPSPLKKAVFAMVVFAGLVVFGEGLMAAWYFQVHGRHSWALVEAYHLLLDIPETWPAFQGKSNVPPRDSVQTSSEPSPMYRADPELGYALNPGDYTITLRLGERVYPFQVGIDPAGHRRTRAAAAVAPAKTPPRVAIFGDSFAWGWGNPDPTVFAWILQSLLPQADITNFALNGYGNVHALLQLRRLARENRLPEILVVAYADYFDERNVGSPEYLNRINTPRFQEVFASDGFMFPIARENEAGELMIERIPLQCGAENPCNPNVPAPGQWSGISVQVLQAIRRLTEPRPALLVYLQGKTDPPVVRAARQMGFRIVDARDQGALPWDDFSPFDGHPGPRAQMAIAGQIHRALAPLVDALTRVPAASPDRAAEK